LANVAIAHVELCFRWRQIGEYIIYFLIDLLAKQPFLCRCACWGESGFWSRGHFYLRHKWLASQFFFLLESPDRLRLFMRVPYFSLRFCRRQSREDLVNFIVYFRPEQMVRGRFSLNACYLCLRLIVLFNILVGWQDRFA